MCGCKTWSVNRIRCNKALKSREMRRLKQVRCIRQMNTVPLALVLRPNCVREKVDANKKDVNQK